MSTAAWWMLGVTWTVVVVFNLRFFWRVLTIDRRSARAADPGEP